MPWIQHTHPEENKTMNVQYLNEAGSFDGEVIRPEAGWFGESKEKKTPFVRIPVVITDGMHKGKVAVWQGWLSDRAADTTIARLAEVFGFNGDLNALYQGTATLEGLPCNITTEVETYDGKDRCKVAWLNPVGGGGPKPMDEAKVKALLSKLTPKAKAIAKTIAPAPKAPDAEREPDDDVPF